MDFDSPATTLVVTFGGLRQRVGIPYFEFVKMLRPYALKKLFVRDIHGLWYQRGVPGIPGGVAGLRDLLKDVIREAGIQRTVFIGNSGGGYAAILFGALVDASEVHAFNPKSNIDPLWRLRKWDIKDFNIRSILRLLLMRGRDKQYDDLARVLADTPQTPASTSITVRGTSWTRKIVSACSISPM